MFASTSLAQAAKICGKGGTPLPGVGLPGCFSGQGHVHAHGKSANLGLGLGLWVSYSGWKHVKSISVRYWYLSTSDYL